MILISIKQQEAIKIKIKMISILISMIIINRKKKLKKMQFQIYLIFQEEDLYHKLIILNKLFNNKMLSTFLIMERVLQDLLRNRTISIKIHSKMFLALEVKILSIKIYKLMYHRCNRRKCSSNHLINKTKKSQNSFPTLYLCHKYNPILVNNNYFINNKYLVE